MRISKKTQQATLGVTNTSREYESKSTVLRESVVSFSIRLFFAEFLLGLLGIGLRIPMLYVLNQYTNPITTYAGYALIYLVFQLINLFMLVVLILDWYNRTYVIRSKDIAVKKGILSSQENYIQYDNIEKVDVYQSLFGRLFNYGSIQIYNPLLKSDVYFNNIPNPSKHALAIQKVVPKNTEKIIINK